MIEILDPVIEVFGGLLGKVVQYAGPIGERLWKWLWDFTGGNAIFVGLIISFVLYLCIDLVYHLFVDKPTAQAGSFMLSRVKDVVIFILIFSGVFVLIGSGGI